MSFATVVVVVCQVWCCVVDAWGTMKLRFIHGTPQEKVLFPWGPQWNSGVPVVCPYLEQCHAVVALKDAFCLSLLRRIGSCSQKTDNPSACGGSRVCLPGSLGPMLEKR